MGWEHVEGDDHDPAATERGSFVEVLLLGRLRAAIRKLNPAPDGTPWLDEARIDAAVSQLTRAAGAGGLVASNRSVMDLVVGGISVAGDPDLHGGRDVVINVIDFDRPDQNDFLAISQFKVQPSGPRRAIIPDIVLFVNGLPLVVIECKSPAATDPMEEAINQLLRYSNQRSWIAAEEGVERLFHYNALLIGTTFYDARLATVGAEPEHFLRWKDTAPLEQEAIKALLGVELLQPQQVLAAGVLQPEHLLDIVRNFTVYETTGGRLVKKVARYQQFSVVHAAIDRLLHPVPTHPGGPLVRGGVIWHTQGSGKSLTMVFLILKLRTIPELKTYKVVLVTDRRHLERQLLGTTKLTGETAYKATGTDELISRLKEDGGSLVFAMIHKYRVHADEAEKLTTARGEELVLDEEPFPVCNTSDRVLVLVDEAHRSHTSRLHANLLRALPNAARIAFTGTPILLGNKQKTHEIFGDFIGTPYTLRQSEEDGATLPIKYEGREATQFIRDPAQLDAALESEYPDAEPEELEAIKARFVTSTGVRQAPMPIAVKAADMLRHYIDVVHPNGLKAQLVAATRVAAVRYRDGLEAARDRLVSELTARTLELEAVPDDQLAGMEGEDGFYARAYRRLDEIRSLEFAAVISHRHNQDPALNEWTDEAKSETRVEDFKKPFKAGRPENASNLSILCVKSMLLTGFDAPIEQVLYVDRPMQGAELLQAIARVNRTAPNKSHGLVVDYAAVGKNLATALAVYAEGDVQGVLTDIADELPKLADRHTRAVAVFTDNAISSIEDIDACVELLADVSIRAKFALHLRLFLQSLDAVLPRPEALPYMRDAKILGFINKAAANLYRDGGLMILGAGRKVQALIDAHLRAHGIDPKIPPISVLDANFAEAVGRHRSPRTQASEMEHAARYHIDIHMAEDPARFRRLSERLQAILDELSGDWDALVAALKVFIEELAGDELIPDTGLDPRTQAPFLRLLLDAAATDLSDPDLDRYTQAVVALVATIRDEVGAIDFWRNEHSQDRLRHMVAERLDEDDLVPFERLERTADEIVDLARALHLQLIR